MEMVLDFTTSLWELTNHQIHVVAQTCVLCAMGEVTGALLLAISRGGNQGSERARQTPTPWFSVLVTEFACKRIKFGPQEAILPSE